MKQPLHKVAMKKYQDKRVGTISVRGRRQPAVVNLLQPEAAEESVNGDEALPPDEQDPEVQD